VSSATGPSVSRARTMHDGRFVVVAVAVSVAVVAVVVVIVVCLWRSWHTITRARCNSSGKCQPTAQTGSTGLDLAWPLVGLELGTTPWLCGRDCCCCCCCFLWRGEQLFCAAVGRQARAYHQSQIGPKRRLCQRLLLFRRRHN